MCKILQILRHNGIDTEKVLTTPTEKGGAVTFSISDALTFIATQKRTNERSYIDYLIHHNLYNQNNLESLFKHMFFSKDTARRFVAWQRGKKVGGFA